jgi:hypothetical protein
MDCEQWTVNSTTWNHLQTMWQAQPLDLLRLIYEETHHQNVLEASGYRSPTWCILRALQSIFQANVVVGESIISAAPFFEGAGRPSKPFWGPQQGRRVILWESLRPEDQEKCLTELQSDRHWVIWCKAKQKDMAAQLFREGVMGAGIVCFQRPGRNLVVRVGREEEGVSSLRPELAAIACTLQATSLEVDLLYLCDSEASLNKVSRWIGSGPRTTLASDANADIMTSIIECVRESWEVHVLSWSKSKHIQGNLLIKELTSLQRVARRHQPMPRAACRGAGGSTPRH